MQKKTALATMVAVLAFLAGCATDSRKAQEEALQQDLLTLRSVLSQYILDLHRRPRSLDDLVEAGYLKAIPTNPINGRNDTWTVKCSTNPKDPGIERIDASDSPVGAMVNHCDRRQCS